MALLCWQRREAKRRRWPCRRRQLFLDGAERYKILPNLFDALLRRRDDLWVLARRADEHFPPGQHFRVRGDLVVNERTIEIESAVETDVQQTDPQVSAQFGGRLDALRLEDRIKLRREGVGVIQEVRGERLDRRRLRIGRREGAFLAVEGNKVVGLSDEIEVGRIHVAARCGCYDRLAPGKSEQGRWCRQREHGATGHLFHDFPLWMVRRNTICATSCRWSACSRRCAPHPH